nr:10777_t:CDS:2 [Entrophospora candida]
MTSPASRKVAVALDPGSEETEYTIDWIIENFLKPDRDDVHLVSALYLNSDFDVTELGMNINYAAEYVKKWENEIEGKTRKSMEPFVEKLKAANINCKVEIIKTQSDSRNLIVDYTENEKVDVLVMGSKDLTLWKRLFLGSFSEYCQHNAHCPVLIVKKPRK